MDLPGKFSRRSIAKGLAVSGVAAFSTLAGAEAVATRRDQLCPRSLVAFHRKCAGRKSILACGVPLWQLPKVLLRFPAVSCLLRLRHSSGCLRSLIHPSMAFRAWLRHVDAR